MKIGLLCCWASMRIYPIYSTRLRHSLEALTGEPVSVITTDCFCFDRDDPVDDRYEFIKLPYPFTQHASANRARYFVKMRLYHPIERLRGNLLASRSKEFDVVDFQQSSYAFGYDALRSFLNRKSRAAKVVTIHKLDQIPLDRPQLNKIYNRADAVIVFSEYYKNLLAGQGVDPDRVAVIYHGTALEPVADVVKDQVIMFCGSPIPNVKGFEHFVVTLQTLQEEGMRLKTKIYGFFSHADKDYTSRLVAEHGVDRLIEWQSFDSEAQLTAEHQRSLFCLIPYTGYAGYFAAAYSMGNALPVIATDILGHAEYVKESGLLIEPGSPAALTSAIKQLLGDEDLRKRLGENGRKRAEAELGWDDVARSTLGVFKQAIARRNG